jgi:putative acetyltransferase
MMIKIGDFTGSKIQALLPEHLVNMAEHSPPESIQALHFVALQASEITFWTGWAQDELLSCGALRELDSTHGEIKSMRTATAHRRRGVARQFMAHIIAEATRRNYRRLSLETGSRAAFAPARLLYQRFGFVECPPFADYVLDVNSVCMTKWLR